MLTKPKTGGVATYLGVGAYPGYYSVCSVGVGKVPCSWYQHVVSFIYKTSQLVICILKNQGYRMYPVPHVLRGKGNQNVNMMQS